MTRGCDCIQIVLEKSCCGSWLHVALDSLYLELEGHAVIGKIYVDHIDLLL
jgi:hypothetical protein